MHLTGKEKKWFNVYICGWNNRVKADNFKISYQNQILRLWGNFHLCTYVSNTDTLINAWVTPSATQQINCIDMIMFLFSNFLEVLFLFLEVTKNIQADCIVMI